MTKMMTDDRPFRYVCGKCRGRGLYRDDDFLVGDFSIVCPTCGNRYYGDVGGKTQGAAPVKEYYTPEPPPPAGAIHFALERTANILTGPDLIRRRRTEKEEDSMTVTRPCNNCGRVLTIIGGGCCYVCYHAGKGLIGTAKDAARAAIKAKIESGVMKKGGGHRGPKPKGILAPKPPVIAPEGAANPASPAAAVPTYEPVPARFLESAPPKSPAALAPMSDAAVSKAMVDAVRDDKKGARLFALGGFLPANLLAESSPGRIIEDTPEIFIAFTDERDQKLHAALIAEAARLRRTPEQQILWMLQNAIDQEKSLLAEAGR